MAGPSRGGLALAAAALLLVLAACSLDYEQARVAEAIPGETPDTVLLDFKHTVVSGGKVWIVLEAARAETYGEKKQIFLFDVHFQEYDSAGKLLTELSVERATFNTQSEDASALGTIVIYSSAEKASLRTTGELAWTREGKLLEAGDQQAVRLQKDDGSFVEGRGFAADFRRKTLSFSEQVRGSYVRERTK
jgi:lipopolysaccharide export system protein LptC